MHRSAILLLVLASFAPAQEKTDPFFDRTIAPLLTARCLECHSGASPKGGLSLTTRAQALEGGDSGPALKPGKLDSLLWQRVLAGEMPPKKPLAEAEKKLLREWLIQGASWGTSPLDPLRFTTTTRAGFDWWSLQPVKRPTLPVVKKLSWPKNPLDRFVLERLEAKGLTPAPEADRRTLIRRVTFDLLGLPPTPGEMDAFVNDPAPAAYEKLVERLLASPQHGERWARHWLDIVRFGESNGFEHDELRRTAWPYRDWVINALNSDMPYDEFARLQLAGDVLRPDDPGAVAATGFLVAGAYDTVGQVQQSAAMKAVVRQDELEDMVATLGQAFLGLTVQCARCHDHKFDPVRQSEYYRLTAALAGVRHGQRDVTPLVRRQALEQERATILQHQAIVTKQLRGLEQVVEQRILAERKQSPPAVPVPRPLLRWDFTRELPKEVQLQGDARLSADGLQLTGKSGFAMAGPLPVAITARTLAVWVKLADLKQRGGAAISLQTLDGNVFDAIVFGEKEPGQWMAGSEFFRRTRSFQAPGETEADRDFVHLALTYSSDGTITAYRNGRLHGKPYQGNPPVTFATGKARVVFGVRHTPAQPGRMLAGIIRQAELHDRALTAREVAAAAGRQDFLTTRELLEQMTSSERAQWQRWREELAGHAKALAAGETKGKQLIYAVTPRPPEPTFVLLRGEPGRKGAGVTAGGVAALAGLSGDFGLDATASDAERRRKLADWITHPKNPLFPRVIVNRLWQHHFGVGLVDTPSDFGFNGGRPTHPELLDWLASELVQPQSAARNSPPFGLRHIQRLIVTSATYRQQSTLRNPQAALVDAGNRLLWRKSPLRLEAEVLRDALLQVAGKLDTTRGGPGYQDFTVSIRGATYTYQPRAEEDSTTWRRSIYRTWARSGRNSLLTALDCPDPSSLTPARSVTTTPLQALSLLNNSFVLRMADHFADRVRAAGGKELEQQIVLAYRLALGRSPAAEEVPMARAVVQEHGLAVLCRALFNCNEFLYVD